MLIKLFYTNTNEIEVEEESQIIPFEVVNNNIYMRVDGRMTLNSEGEMVADSEGSIQLKFETPYNQEITTETRKALYSLYHELASRQEQIESLVVLHDEEIVLFDSRELGYIPQAPFLVDTALNMEQNNDKYLVVTVPMIWGG